MESDDLEAVHTAWRSCDFGPKRIGQGHWSQVWKISWRGLTISDSGSLLFPVGADIDGTSAALAMHNGTSTTCLKNDRQVFFYNLQQLEHICAIFGIYDIPIFLTSKVMHKFPPQLSCVATLPENTLATE